jgi:hypothetical protein
MAKNKKAPADRSGDLSSCEDSYQPISDRTQWLMQNRLGARPKYMIDCGSCGISAEHGGYKLIFLPVGGCCRDERAAEIAANRFERREHRRHEG